MQRAFGASEIDQYIRTLQRCRHIRTDMNSARRADQLAGIFAEQRAAAVFQRGVQHQIIGL